MCTNGGCPVSVGHLRSCRLSFKSDALHEAQVVTVVPAEKILSNTGQVPESPVHPPRQTAFIGVKNVERGKSTELITVQPAY